MRIWCPISFAKYVSKGRDCRRYRAVGPMGFNRMIIFPLKAFDLTNLGTRDSHWIFGILGVWEILQVRWESENDGK